MDNAVKFDKVAPLIHDQYHRVPADLVAQLNERSAGSEEDRAEVPEAGRADQEIPRPQGPALDLAERGEVPSRVRARRS